MRKGRFGLYLKLKIYFMFKLYSKKILINLFFISIAIGLFSCGSTKQLKYFQDLPDSTKLSYIKLPAYEAPTVHVGDIIGVEIYTIDLSATASVNVVTNAPIATLGGANIDYEENGFVVDKGGEIDIPELGKIKVEGFTIEQIQVLVKAKALTYFNDPIVIVKNKSFKLTFLGEFQKTGTFIIQRPKITIIDALGLAGGLTDFGKRDDILLLRHNQDNTLSSIRVNLLSSNILKSPYYYLQPNDVLLANPTKSKGIVTDQTFSRYLTLYSLIGSLITTLVVLIKH